MKVIGVIGVIVSVAAISLALHLHFIYAKAVDLLQSGMEFEIREKGLEYLQSSQYRSSYEAIDFETTYGTLVMLLGAASILLCIYPAVKKFKVAWFGVSLGLISFIIGAAYGTHMFS